MNNNKDGEAKVCPTKDALNIESIREYLSICYEQANRFFLLRDMFNACLWWGMAGEIQDEFVEELELFSQSYRGKLIV